MGQSLQKNRQYGFESVTSLVSVASVTENFKEIPCLIFRILVLLFPLLLSANLAQAAAEPKGDVEIVLKQLKVAKHGNAELLEGVDGIKPGEVVEYQATYHNVSKHAVRKLQATLPIPAETLYLPGTAKPAAVQASVDGITYADIPLRRKVKTTDGRILEQDIPVAEYRSLRWAIGELNAGQETVVSARVHLEPVATGGKAR